MKELHFYITSALGGLCLLLVVFATVIGKTTSTLQQRLQQQQMVINSGNRVNQLLQNILQRDLGPAALRNPKIKEVLAHNGINVAFSPNAAAPAQAPAAAPAAPAPTSTTPAQ